MREMTEKNLNDAFGGESMAHMRYVIFGDEAEKKGMNNLTRMFRAIAYAERIHAGNHFRVLGDLGDTPENIQACIDGETYEVEEMYPAFKAVAELQGEKDAIRSTTYALETEKVHAEMYKRAKEVADRDEDIDIGKVQVCAICGYTMEGEPPEKCPVCGAPREKIREFA